MTTGLSLLEILFSGISALLAYFLWEYRNSPAGVPVFVMILGAALYSFVAGASTLVANDVLTSLLSHLRWPIGGLVSAGAFYTGVEYTNATRLQSRRVLGVVVAFLAIDLVVFLTNPLHELAMANPRADPEYGVLAFDPGPLLLVHLVVAIGLGAVGLGLLLGEYLQRSVVRHQVGVLVVGIGLGLGFFVLESAVTLHPSFNLATVGLTGASVVLLWAVVRGEFLETVPIARETLMQSMEDLVIALDSDDRVITLNHAARDLADTRGSTVGKPVEDVFESSPELVQGLTNGSEPSRHDQSTPDDRRVSLEEGGETRHFDLNVSPIRYRSVSGEAGPDLDRLGRLVVVRDVTETRRREEELQLLKQVFARVLRHNLRNDLNIISGHATLLSERVDEGHVHHADLIIDQTDHLVDLSEKARQLEQLIESPDENLRFDLAEVVGAAAGGVREEYQDAEIDVDVDETIAVTAHGALEIALENVIENACEHHPTNAPRVDVSCRPSGDRVDLVIEDDGPGIPEHEIEVLSEGAETKLAHGSGLGLWIVTWVIDRSEGEVSIERRDVGTRVMLELHRAN